jgi:hypothetical protein
LLTGEFRSCTLLVKIFETCSGLGVAGEIDLENVRGDVDDLRKMTVKQYAPLREQEERRVGLLLGDKHEVEKVLDFEGKRL